MPNEFTALTTIRQPGSYAIGYQRGAEVTGQVVEDWGLVVGEDVVAGDLAEEDTPARPVSRPDDGANRAEWESWAVANGMSEPDAAEASMDDLMAAGNVKPKRRAAAKSSAGDPVAMAATEGTKD